MADLSTDRSGHQGDLDRIDWRLPFRRIRHAVAQHYLLIIVSCVVSLLLLVLYRQVFPPIYKASVVIQAEPNVDPVRSTYYANWNVFRKTDLPSEPEFVTTGRVVDGVVSKLGLKFDDVHHSLFTHAAYLWTESWLGRNYRNFKKWLFPPEPGTYQPTDEEIDAGRTRDAFAKSVKVEVVQGTTFASIEVKAPTFRAAEFANLLADTYLAERNRLFREEANSAFEALQTEVARARAELAELEDRRLSFDKENKIVLDFEKDKLVVSNWATLQASIYDIRSSIESLEASRAVIEKQLALEPQEITASKSLADSRIKGLLQTREFELNASVQLLKDRYRPDSPEVTQLEEKLADTRASLKRESAAVEIGRDRTINPVYNDLRQRLNLVHGQLASARAALAQKQAPLQELEKRMYSVPTLIKQIGVINRDREGLELRYKLLRERAMMADVSRATVSVTAPSVRIIDYARPSANPVWPRNIVVVPAALGMGLFIGLALALMLELLSSRINRDRLASRRDMPVYGVFRWPGAPAAPRDRSAGDPLGLLALRLRGELPVPDSGGRSLLVVGTDDEVGKQAALGLAWSFADELGHSVLLIDGTFGNGSLGLGLGMSDRPGLVDWLKAGGPDAAETSGGLDALVQHTAHPRVKVLTRGSPPQSIAITEGAMRSMLRQACAAHDIVLVLGSLLTDVHRSLACAAAVDAAVLVAVEEVSTLEEVARGQRLLDECGAARVALVLANGSIQRRSGIF